ncbi:Transglutaminase-like superfamily [Actinomyces bovis]|uniref:Transglutaminase-like superfamily n=1 Tax=Actinomyces bovis TaxID=1658 RepID=A0ABY1VLZ1_9ACTO|nr:transglutaminase-like domain-containing protein [Actinomyces bovis]SPT53118.1 Transglutaminase-like superfamily [Actinomyces bovis]VEG52257.1 Transglutaminase-like superfamily [Actinomyces israelii]
MTTQTRERIPSALSFMTFLDLGMVLLALLLGTVHFAPAWGGVIGPVAAGVGAVIGLAIGWISSARRWGPLATLLAVVAVHLGLAPWILPDVGEGLSAITAVATSSLSVWRDALTLSPPLTAFTGMTVLPWLTGLLTGVLATRLVLSGYAHLGGLACLVMPFVALLWGTRAPFLPALTCPPLAAALLLLWAMHARRRSRGSIAEAMEIGDDGAARTDRRSGLMGVAVVAAAMAIAMAVNPAVPGARMLLRDRFTPPLDLAQYATPLSLVRLLETEMVDTELLKLREAPAGVRLRIAALDSYDGTVASIGEDATGVARFRPVGDGTLLNDLDRDAVRTVSLEVTGYNFAWVPTVRDVRSTWVTGPRQHDLRGTLYFDALSGTLLTTASTATGDVFTEEVVPNQVPSDATLSTLELDKDAPGKVADVPVVIATRAATLIGSEATDLGKIRALQQALRTGYYSDGTKSPSTPGHGAARLSTMVENGALIGDAEQYSVLMMLMCRSLGIPARVIMGFDPAIDGDATQVTGTDVTAWVEIPFKGVGWVPFDVTPDRDNLPQQQTEERVSNPLPQALQPPLAPQDPAELPPNYQDEQKPNDDDEPEQPRSYLALGIAGGVLALLLPFALIVCLKAWRRRRRQRLRSAIDRVEGAWDEVLDRARDLGVQSVGGRTRHETATDLDSSFPDAGLLKLSRDVDKSVFSEADPADDDATGVWRAVEASIPAMGFCRSRFQRALARVSLASLVHPAGRVSRGRRTSRRYPR